MWKNFSISSTSSAAIGYMLALKLPELWVWQPSGQEKRFPLEASITFQPRLKLINSISNKCTLATMSYETDVNVNFLILPIYRPTDWLTDWLLLLDVPHSGWEEAVRYKCGWNTQSSDKFSKIFSSAFCWYLGKVRRCLRKIHILS